MLVARDILAENPGMGKRALITRARAAVSQTSIGRRLQHAKSLQCQGQVFRCSTQDAATIWSTAIQMLPSRFLGFSLNAVQDTLPHNDNLARWRRKEGLSSDCKLCGQRQTLLHVLNSCPRALQLRRYNERHDAVLSVIVDFMTETILADLPAFQPYIFPPHITATDSRPDIVVWSNSLQEVWVLELTICFETGFDEAHNRKTGRYSDLMEQITETTWDGCLVTLEVGSRGFISLACFNNIKQQILQCSRRQWKDFLLQVASTVLKGSHKIWSMRNWSDTTP